MDADSHVAPILAQMRIAFRSRVLNCRARRRSCLRFIAWSNFDTTIDRLITEQPKEWLPKEFTSYADLLRACFEDAVKALTKIKRRRIEMDLGRDG